MTAEELNDYEELSEKGRRYYKTYKGMHPGWGHGQLMTMVSILEMDPFPNGKGTDMKAIIAECVRKADEFMEANFPNLYPKVKAIFTTVGNAIRQAVSVTWDFIVSLFSKF